MFLMDKIVRKSFCVGGLFYLRRKSKFSAKFSAKIICKKEQLFKTFGLECGTFLEHELHVL